jgi:hypothetical protein
MFYSCPTTSPILGYRIISLANLELKISLAAWSLPLAIRFLFYMSILTPTPRPPIFVLRYSAFDSLIFCITEAINNF